MGDVADMMIDGTLCQGCGVYIEEESFGVPRYCDHCLRQEELDSINRGALQQAASMKVPCPTCGKRVKSAGLKDHQRDVHAEGKTGDTK